MECFVGTSGWVYDWNPDGLDWYVEHSGLNAVELNMSFYRLPSRSLVESWRRRGARLRWAVKIHQAVTHRYRLSDRALSFWDRFRKVFAPLDDIVDFYLLQLPPSFRMTEASRERLRRFAEHTGLGPRLAVEFRHPSWLTGDGVKTVREIGATLVSVDSPIATWVARTTDYIYLRLHGRTAWYAHDYTASELRELVEKAVATRPARIYVFFNNNHWMLENARQMKTILEALGCSIRE